LTIAPHVRHPILTASFVSKKENNLYYLLPGQGRGARRRYLRNLIVALIVGSLTAGLLFLVFWYYNEH
jgi:hypothetical protein